MTCWSAFFSLLVGFAECRGFSIDADWTSAATAGATIFTALGVAAELVRRILRHFINQKMKRNPCRRFEILNAIYKDGVITILIQNRSQVKTYMRRPVFEVRGHRVESWHRRHSNKGIVIAPQEDYRFHSDASGDEFVGIGARDCRLVDMGQGDRV